MKARKIRCLLTKSRMDAHDRGVMTIAAAFRDAGLEVIFTRFADVREIATVALQEEVDIIGVSSLAGSHLSIAEQLKEALIEKGIEDMLIIFGGIIPKNDVSKLHELGVYEAFGAGISFRDIINKVRSAVDAKRGLGSD